MTATTRDYLSSQEIQQLLGVIDNARDRAIVILFLSTGLFLRELASVRMDDILWDERVLKVRGKRQRDLPISSECGHALALWMEKRGEIPRNPLCFVSSQENRPGLSVRQIGFLVGEYAKKAGIRKRVSPNTLRNTFAIRLINSPKSVVRSPAPKGKNGIRPKTEIARLLGMTLTSSVDRFSPKAEVLCPDPTIPNNPPSNIVDDSPLAPFSDLTHILAIKPHIQKPDRTASEVVNPDTLMIGREKVIQDIISETAKGQSILLTGPYGVGKSHLLQYLANMKPYNIILVSSPIPIRQLLLTLLGHFLGSTKDIARLTISELLALIIQEKPLIRPVIAIDNLDRLKVPDMDIILTLLKHITIIGATNEATDRLKPLWWKFQSIELPPLTEKQSKELIHQLTHHLAISDYDLMETQILKLANGLPLAIADMAGQLQSKHVVTRQAVRSLNHSAGLKYRSWDWVLALMFSGMIMARFIALGTHNYETYILAGIGLGIFGGLRLIFKRYQK